MKKKIFVSLISFIAFMLGVVGMSAYESHVVNVTATIEMAMEVDTTPIDFGTVFPQEAIDEFVDIGLSESFLEQDRVTTVDYMIRQKPKCWSESEKAFGVVDEDEDGNFYCKDGEAYSKLPLLCPYLSKHEVTDEIPENDSEGINAFHGSVDNWTMTDTVDTQVLGQLDKQYEDILDTWKIDLRTPCFGDQCAQDWEEFVLENNPTATASAYILPGDLEEALFGCDLWIEVTGITGPDPREQACIDSGGMVGTSSCCQSANSFPDTCATGACGCAPEESQSTLVCNCPQDTCWNGQECVSTSNCDGMIYGYKYDTEQNPVEGWAISLLDHDLGSTTAITQTDSHGYYEFENLCADGHYGVYEELKPNWAFFSPSIGYYYDVIPGTMYNFVNERLSIGEGEVVINEIMPNPSEVSDSYGEWFEVINTTQWSLDLDGCTIQDNDSDSHIINGSLVVPPGGYAVLGNNEDSSANGGVTIDYQYSDFMLANSGDEIVLICDGVEIDRVEYSDLGWPFDAGISMSLDNPSTDNNNVLNWCYSSSSFGDGDLGTPRSLNDVCSVN